MRLVSPVPDCAGTSDGLMGAFLPERRDSRHAERMGNTPSSPFASPPDPQR